MVEYGSFSLILKQHLKKTNPTVINFNLISSWNTGSMSTEFIYQLNSDFDLLYLWISETFNIIPAQVGMFLKHLIKPTHLADQKCHRKNGLAYN